MWKELQEQNLLIFSLIFKKAIVLKGSRLWNICGSWRWYGISGKTGITVYVEVLCVLLNNFSFFSLLIRCLIKDGSEKGDWISTAYLSFKAPSIWTRTEYKMHETPDYVLWQHDEIKGYARGLWWQSWMTDSFHLSVLQLYTFLRNGSRISYWFQHSLCRILKNLEAYS